MPVAGDDVPEVEQGARARNGERKGGVQVGEGAVDEPNRAKGVGCCECGAGEAGEGEAETGGSLKIKKS